MDDGRKSAVITASVITVAENAGDMARFYDKDGNAIPENALDNYFSVLSTGGEVTAQAGTSMLAQANQSNQSVLALLQ